MGTIGLEGMEFYAYHGVCEEENIIGNRFVVDLELILNFDLAMCSDVLNDTVDYQAVYSLVAIEMQQTAKLIEHLAYRIQQTILKQYPQLESVQVKVFKYNPPVGGKLRCTYVKL